jgi:hypothetical protein
MHARQIALESDVENYLVSQVEAAGGVAEKTVSPGRRGYFDRVVVLPRLPAAARVVFVEVKRPRRSRTPPQQSRRHNLYLKLGAEVVVLRSRADVDRLINRGLDSDRADLKQTQDRREAEP